MNRVCSTKENLMKILCKSTQQIPASTQVKRVGKYLYKHLETSYDFNSGSNMYDVYFTLYYQKKHPKLGIAINGIQEIQININITTYQNKLRVNTIEVTPQARTLGFDLFTPDKLNDLPSAMKLIMQKVVRRVEKAYEGFDILF